MVLRCKVAGVIWRQLPSQEVGNIVVYERNVNEHCLYSFYDRFVIVDFFNPFVLITKMPWNCKKICLCNSW